MVLGIQPQGFDVVGEGLGSVSLLLPISAALVVCIGELGHQPNGFVEIGNSLVVFLLESPVFATGGVSIGVIGSESDDISCLGACGLTLEITPKNGAIIPFRPIVDPLLRD
jgi:hypothetical protein